MGSISEALAALDAAVELLGAADIDELSGPQRFAVIERVENALRRQVAISHAHIARLERYPGCPPVPIVLADVLRISRSAARRRVRDAEQLTPRATLIGEPLPPLLPATGAAWGAGKLDGEHVRVIQSFLHDLPAHVGPVEAEKAERSLARHAQNLRPDQLEKVAQRLAMHLNPDGKLLGRGPGSQAWFPLVRRSAAGRDERGKAGGDSRIAGDDRRGVREAGGARRG